MNDFLSDPLYYKFLIAVLITAFSGSYFTRQSLDTPYYQKLKKPEWAPPPRVISVIWTVLYLLISYSTFTCYVQCNEVQKKTLLIIFGLQLILNFSWVYLFFGLRNPVASKNLIYVLLFVIFLQGMYMYRIDNNSGYVFLPYFLWVSFATYLNTEIVKLNSL